MQPSDQLLHHAEERLPLGRAHAPGEILLDRVPQLEQARHLALPALRQADEVGAAIARLLVADRRPVPLHDVERRDEGGRVDVGVERERLLVERPVEVEREEDPRLGGCEPEALFDERPLETASDQAPEEQERGSQLPLQVRPLLQPFAGLPILLSIH